MKLVAWTTTPWTLTAHVGLAVHPGHGLPARPASQTSPDEQFLFGDELAKPVPLMTEVEREKRRVDLAVSRPSPASAAGTSKASSMTGLFRTEFTSPPTSAAGRWCSATT